MNWNDEFLYKEVKVKKTLDQDNVYTRYIYNPGFKTKLKYVLNNHKLMTNGSLIYEIVGSINIDLYKELQND